MTKDPVQYNPDVPRWFTYAHHRWSKKTQCNQQGHTITEWPTVCDHCGEILAAQSEGSDDE